MSDAATVDDLRREMAKMLDVLDMCEQHLSHHAAANAALHCSDKVMYSPLHARVTSVMAGASAALMRTEPTAEESQ